MTLSSYLILSKY
jgi:hypothetical protein